MLRPCTSTSCGVASQACATTRAGLGRGNPAGAAGGPPPLPAAQHTPPAGTHQRLESTSSMITPSACVAGMPCTAPSTRHAGVLASMTRGAGRAPARGTMHWCIRVIYTHIEPKPQAPKKKPNLLKPFSSQRLSFGRCERMPAAAGASLMSETFLFVFVCCTGTQENQKSDLGHLVKTASKRASYPTWVIPVLWQHPSWGRSSCSMPGVEARARQAAAQRS